MDRNTQQELCLALGMTLLTGEPIVIGGEKCPPVKRIAERLIALGMKVSRFSKTKRSDNCDDYGSQHRYAVDTDGLPAQIKDFLGRDIGANANDGDDVLADLLLSWPATCRTA